MLGGLLGVWLAAAVGCGHGAELMALPQPVIFDQTTVPMGGMIVGNDGGAGEVADAILRLKTACAWRDRERAAKELADVCWQAHPVAAYALVEALRSDCHEEVREESARSLRLMKPCLPGVREALCAAAQGDGDWQTRWAARRAAKVLASANQDRVPGGQGTMTGRWTLPGRAASGPVWSEPSLFGSDPERLPTIPSAPESYSPAERPGTLPLPLPPPPTVVYPYGPGA